ncbi:hypothetical protein [Paraburkholderia sp. MM5482-R1]|uniref:hypothetical protein n=1 Tax=unclassified Paraburkholderia TaxID=2615204 RepID=UPI003D1E3CDF
MTDKARKQIARCRDSAGTLRQQSLFYWFDRADYLTGTKALELRWPVEFPDDWLRCRITHEPFTPLAYHKRDIADRDKALLHSLFNRYTDGGDGRGVDLSKLPRWLRHPLDGDEKATAFLAGLRGFDKTLARRVVKGMFADWLPLPLLYPDPIKPNRNYNTHTRALTLDKDLLADDERHPYGEKDLLRQVISAEPRLDRRLRMAAILSALSGTERGPTWQAEALRLTDGDDREAIPRQPRRTPEREAKALARLRKTGVLGSRATKAHSEPSEARARLALIEELAKHGLKPHTTT